MRPIAMATPKDLWRPAATEFQIGVLPLYHRHSVRFGTMPSFHATTTRAQYTEKGSASIRLLGVARPADDLAGEVTGAFGVALSEIVRTRQAERAHARAQPTSTGVVPGWQRRTARQASDVMRRDVSSSHGGRAEGGAELPVMAGPSARRVPAYDGRGPKQAVLGQHAVYMRRRDGGWFGNACGAPA